MSSADGGFDLPADADGEPYSGAESLCESWGAFSAPERVANVNTDSSDFGPHESADGLSLLFVSITGYPDFFIATRSSIEEDFGDPEPIVELNTDDEEEGLTMTADGLVLIFSRRQASGSYSAIYQTTRDNTDEPFAGLTLLFEDTQGEIPTIWGHGGPAISPDGLEIYFHASLESYYLFTARRGGRDDAFGEPKQLTALHVDGEAEPFVSSDGLELYYEADNEIYRSVRDDVSDPFLSGSLVSEVNEPTSHDNDPALSNDGTRLYFASDRDALSGWTDIFVATRSCMSR